MAQECDSTILGLIASAGMGGFMSKDGRGSGTRHRPLVIKWIHSHKDEGQLLQIETALHERRYKPTILQYDTAASFEKQLGRHKVDILVVSGRTVPPTKFESLINRATRRYPFDVLYYDVPAKTPTKDRLSLYSVVRVLPNKRFADTLVEMVDDNPSKWQNPRFIRGLVMSRSVDMEVAIDHYIVGYLVRNKKLKDTVREQIHEVMYDYAFALRTKRLILEMIMLIQGGADKKFLNLVDSVGQYRNRFAHAWLGVDDEGNVVSSRSKNVHAPKRTYDKARMWKILCDIDSVILKLDDMGRQAR